MSHSSLSIDITEEHLPNANFFKWVKSNTAFFISQVAAIASIILYICTFIYYVIGHDPTHHTGYEEYLTRTQHLIIILNICFTLIFVTATLYVINKEGKGTEQVKLFHRLVFGREINKNILETGKKHLAEFKIIFLVYWIYVLSFYIFIITIPDDKSENNNSAFLADIRYWKLIIGNILIGILYVSFCKIIQANENRESLQKTEDVKHSLTPSFWKRPQAAILIYFLFCLLPFLYNLLGKPLIVSGWFQLMDLISGIVKMILFSLVFSRFDSKLIGLPSSLVSVLYVYAIIQPLDVALNGSDIVSRSIATTDYAIAFLIKLYFFLILTYAIQTGRMLNFFCCNGEMTRRLDESRFGNKNDKL